MAYKTFIIPENKEEKSNINGKLTNDPDYIIRNLNMEIDSVIAHEEKKLMKRMINHDKQTECIKNNG